MMRVVFNESDYIGKKFNYLTILEFTKVEKYIMGQFNRRCLAKCDCGESREYYFNNIKSGKSKSCGCKPKETSGNTQHNLYLTWSGLIRRCYNKNFVFYKNYGGRGIKVCDRWRHNFKNFLNDMGEKPNLNYSIDRINVDGDYDPSNCRWADRLTQANNTRNSKLLTASNLAKATGYTRERIRQMVNTNQLKPFIISMENLGGKRRIIFSKKAIKYLLNKKNVK